MKSSAASAESIALLIDADNAPAAKIQFILAGLASYGVVNIRRAYGNWKRPELASWEKVLHEYSIQPVQHFDMTKGKNASDMALLIDAMDILYTKNIGTFCLVSSDCDFTPLVLRLRADGKKVIGFGEKKTPAPFVKSCTKFVCFEEEKKKAESAPANKVSKADLLKGDAKLIDLLRSAVEAVQDKEGWAAMGSIGSHLADKGFDRRNYGVPNLSRLFAVYDLFELKKTGNGVPSVRLSMRDQTSARPAEPAVQRWFSENGSWSDGDGL